MASRVAQTISQLGYRLEEIYDGAPMAEAVEAIEAALANLGFERLTELRWHGTVVFRRRQTV